MTTWDNGKNIISNKVLQKFEHVTIGNIMSYAKFNELEVLYLGVNTY